MNRLLWLWCWVVVAACATKGDPPFVQDSAGPTATLVVRMTDDGLELPCAVIDVGQTIEWRNMYPAIAANVTGFGTTELYSPSIIAGGPVGSEIEKGSVKAYAYWRHTFATAGVYEYFDTNRGEPGQKVVDPYYGTVTYVGVSASLQTGVVCVREPGSDQCTAVCCLGHGNGDSELVGGECPTSQCCDPKGKRCLLGAPTAPICAPNLGSVKQAAFRNFECFKDSDCPANSVGKPRRCAVSNQDRHVCQDL
ncbi:MAG: hypothetical protein EXR77_12810 [Myxococcales bacterium]|nr:hypothetical protein [Myxococcales bacterium]